MWIILSILTAFFYAVQGVWSKKTTRSVSIYTATWSKFAFAVPVLLFPLLLIGVPDIAPAFYWSTAGSLIINMVAVTLFVQALKLSPISIVFPLLAFSPVFIILTGYIFLGELPSIYGIFGILIVFAGTYILNISHMKDGLLSPLKAIKNEKGALLMLAVAFMWSFSAALDKVAVLASSPFCYVFVFNLCFTVLYLPFAVFVNRSFFNELKRNCSALKKPC